MLKNAYINEIQIRQEDAINMLHSDCKQIWKTGQRPRDCKRSIYIPIPEKGNAKECSDFRQTIDLTSCVHDLIN